MQIQIRPAENGDRASAQPIVDAPDLARETVPAPESDLGNAKAPARSVSLDPKDLRGVFDLLGRVRWYHVTRRFDAGYEFEIEGQRGSFVRTGNGASVTYGDYRFESVDPLGFTTLRPNSVNATIAYASLGSIGLGLGAINGEWGAASFLAFIFFGLGGLVWGSRSKYYVAGPGSGDTQGIRLKERLGLRLGHSMHSLECVRGDLDRASTLPVETPREYALDRRREGEALESACREAGFTEGAEELALLNGAYRAAIDAVSRPNALGAGDPSGELRTILDEVHRDGAAAVEEALALHRSLDPVRLAAEEKKIELAEQAGQGGARMEIAHKRVELHRQKESRIQALLLEAGNAQIALEEGAAKIGDRRLTISDGTSPSLAKLARFFAEPRA